MKLRHAAALCCAMLLTGCATRFGCWDGNRWLTEGYYEHFEDNTLKECDNPAGNGFQLGLGMILPDQLNTIRSCETDSPQTCMDKQQVIQRGGAGYLMQRSN